RLGLLQRRLRIAPDLIAQRAELLAGRVDRLRCELLLGQVGNGRFRGRGVRLRGDEKEEDRCEAPHARMVSRSTTEAPHGRSAPAGKAPTGRRHRDTAWP